MKKSYQQYNKPNYNKEKLIWEGKIRKVVDPYKEFMHIADFPNFEIKFVINPKIKMKVLNDKKPMVLLVDLIHLLNKESDYISTLFHEFTHMYDNSTLLLDKEEKYRKSALNLYTEYHASYIQALYLLGVSDISNANKFEVNLNKLFEKMKNQIEEIELRAKIYSEDNLIEKFNDVIKCYMYYYGSLVAYNEYSDERKEIQSFDFVLDTTLREFFKALEFNIVTDNLFEVSHKMQTLADKTVVQRCLEDNMSRMKEKSNI